MERNAKALLRLHPLVPALMGGEERILGLGGRSGGAARESGPGGPGGGAGERRGVVERSDDA